jgi:hypothetical protein
MKYIFILALLISFSFGQNLIKNGSYVLDNKNYLSWQDTPSNSKVKKQYEDAVKYCKNLRLGNYNNWTLPTVKQYKTIINTKTNKESAISDKFKYIIPVDYWTNDTRWQSLNKYAYYIFFKSGSIYYNNKSNLKYVRCVRKIK